MIVAPVQPLVEASTNNGEMVFEAEHARRFNPAPAGPHAWQPLSLPVALRALFRRRGDRHHARTERGEAEHVFLELSATPARRLPVTLESRVMKSYLLPSLVKDVTTLGPDAFIARYDHDWLLWEPGEWKPARERSGTTVNAEQQHATPALPGATLVMALQLPPGVDRLVLGRAADCPLSINDQTLSGHHLAFSKNSSGHWQVEDLGSRNGSFVGEVKLVSGQLAPLLDEQVLQAGSVHLRFLSTRALAARLTRR